MGVEVINSDLWMVGDDGAWQAETCTANPECSRGGACIAALEVCDQWIYFAQGTSGLEAGVLLLDVAFDDAQHVWLTGNKSDSQGVVYERTASNFVEISIGGCAGSGLGTISVEAKDRKLGWACGMNCCHHLDFQNSISLGENTNARPFVQIAAANTDPFTNIDLWALAGEPNKDIWHYSGSSWDVQGVDLTSLAGSPVGIVAGPSGRVIAVTEQGIARLIP
jgi:hypothetical protein